MKVRVSFKTPDALYYALQDFSEEEKSEIEKLARKWIKYDECVTIEIDTETETAKVLPC